MVTENPLAKANRLVAQAKTGLNNELRLIASANYASPQVKNAIGGAATDLFAEGSVGMRYVGGSDDYDAVEAFAIETAKSIFHADYATVQPLSGALANYAVYQALLEPGDSILAMDLSAGGHLTHGAPFNLSGKLYRFANYGLTTDEKIDYEQLAELADKTKPKLIVAGSSSYPRQIDVDAMREIADRHGSYLHFDAAHYVGLIAGGQYPNPMDHGADSMSFSTYKTVWGPRGACIVGKEEVGKKIERAVFPGLQSGPNEGSVAGIAVALAQTQEPEFAEYTRQTIANARATASQLQKYGYHVVTGGTDTHIVLIDLHQSDNSASQLTGADVEERCRSFGITVNKNLVAGDTLPAHKTSGVRLGLQAMTTRGIKVDDAVKIADFVNEAIVNPKREGLAREVFNFCEAHPIPT